MAILARGGYSTLPKLWSDDSRHLRPAHFQITYVHALRCIRYRGLQAFCSLSHAAHRARLNRYPAGATFSVLLHFCLDSFRGDQHRLLYFGGAPPSLPRATPTSSGGFFTFSPFCSARPGEQPSDAIKTRFILIFLSHFRSQLPQCLDLEWQEC